MLVARILIHVEDRGLLFVNDDLKQWLEKHNNTRHEPALEAKIGTSLRPAPRWKLSPNSWLGVSNLKPSELKASLCNARKYSKFDGDEMKSN